MSDAQTSHRSPTSRWRDSVELISSMRFAVSLLTVICIASVAGTVLQQNQPLPNYVDQFGPFWAEFFDVLSLYGVYNAWWFLLIMAFLVISTGICVIRNAPSMMRDSLSFRDHVREGSWRSFPHRAEATASMPTAAAAERAGMWLRKRGFKVRVKQNGESVLVAAKAGTANRLGYIFAHVSIVVICIGGLFDSELPVRMQVWLGSKQPVYENLRLSEVPDSGRLALSNPSYRASALIPEGVRTSSAVVMVDDGALVQPLPFSLELKDFKVDYYSTGMPSDFASDVIITDPETGESFEQTIRVNEPLKYKGVTVYQSSFDDGGSAVTVTGYPLDGARTQPFTLNGTIGSTLQVDNAAGPERHAALRFSALRPINVENLSDPGAKAPMAFGEHVAAVTGSAVRDNKSFTNVGPSIEYQLTDASGQSTDFHNYMLPVMLDGTSVFLLGTRPSAAEAFRYLRIPADADNSMSEFLLLSAALADPAMRAEAARRFAQRNAVPGAPTDAAAEAVRAIEDSVIRTLDVFQSGGLLGITEFLESNVPSDELPRAAEVVIRLLGGALAELRQLAREEAGMPPLESGDEAQMARDDTWLRLALAALSDLSVYPAPVAFMLSDFEHVEASVFQMSRTPGKMAVYFGCLLLVLGVFSMFYIRERRLWVWLRPEAEGSRALMAMTSQRRTLDFNRDFERLSEQFDRLFRKQEAK